MPRGSAAKLTETRVLDEDSYTNLLAHGSLANSLRFKFFAESNGSAESGNTKVHVCHASESVGAPADAGMPVASLRPPAGGTRV